MQRSLLFFGLFSIVALGGAVAACSSTTTTVDNVADAAPEGAAPKDAGKDTATVEEDSGTTVRPDKQCAALATAQDCTSCCGTNHETGAALYTKTAIDCACKGIGIDAGAGTDAGAAGGCATECADTFCAATPKTPSPACATCLQAAIQPGGACNEQVASVCLADTDCVALQKCVGPCQSKK